MRQKNTIAALTGLQFGMSMAYIVHNDGDLLLPILVAICSAIIFAINLRSRYE